MRAEKKVEYQKRVRMEEISRHRKSRISLLKDREEYKAFSLNCKMKSGINTIHKLKVGDEWVFEENIIANNLVDFYKSFYLDFGAI